MQQRRHFVNQKLLFLLIIVLKFYIEEDQIKYHRFFNQDLELCPTCFQNQSDNCKDFFNKIEPSTDLDLRNLFTIFLPTERRQIDFLKFRDTNIPVVAKYLVIDKQLLRELRREELRSAELAKRFQDENRLDGVQFCSANSLPRFIQLFQPENNELTIWLYLLLNVQPLLMPYLSAHNFPVPQHYGTCGFSIFQQYAGEPLVKFYGNEDFTLKLRITQKLLEGLLQLSEGFEGFRIYVTDLNADNVVYNKEEDRVSFVDLDSVLIVDSTEISQNSTHKHEYIECMDCFAYSPQDICQSSRSDINIFAACQFLREDLKRDKKRGFLHPIPEAYGELTALLNECVDCMGSKCVNRFSSARNLISFIKKILS